MEKSWKTLSIGKRSPEMSFDKSQFTDMSRLRLRVISTNGFTTEVVNVEPGDWE